MTTIAARPAVPPSRTILYGILTLAAMSVLGGIISVVSGLSPTMLDAMGPVGRLSIPLPMIIFQIVVAIGAGSRRRPFAIIGSALIALALLAGVVSGLFDGGYADDRLNAWERAYQVSLIGTIGAVGVLAVVRLVRVVRP